MLVPCYKLARPEVRGLADPSNYDATVWALGVPPEPEPPPPAPPEVPPAPPEFHPDAFSLTIPMPEPAPERPAKKRR